MLMVICRQTSIDSLQLDSADTPVCCFKSVHLRLNKQSYPMTTHYGRIEMEIYEKNDLMENKQPRLQLRM